MSSSYHCNSLIIPAVEGKTEANLCLQHPSNLPNLHHVRFPSRRTSKIIQTSFLTDHRPCVLHRSHLPMALLSSTSTLSQVAPRPKPPNILLNSRLAASARPDKGALSTDVLRPHPLLPCLLFPTLQALWFHLRARFPHSSIFLAVPTLMVLQWAVDQSIWSYPLQLQPVSMATMAPCTVMPAPARSVLLQKGR